MANLLSRAGRLLGLGRADKAQPADSSKETLHARLERAEECREHGDLAGAERLVRDALAVAPLSGAAWAMLGSLRGQQGDIRNARVYLEKAASLGEDSGSVFGDLGNVCRALGERDQAIEYYRKALSVDPDNPALLSNLGLSLVENGDARGGRDCLERAAERAPDFAPVHMNLAQLAVSEGRLTDALDRYEVAARLQPTAGAFCAMGKILTKLGDPDRAIEHLDRALALDPDHADSHWSRAWPLLLLGRYEQGWRDYEWRFQATPLKHRGYTRPVWRGEPLDGRRVLVYWEQGFGDTIQFARYIPLLRQRGASAVYLECQPPLARLMETLPGQTRIIPAGETFSEENFDLHCPIMSLPLCFGTHEDTIPDNVPYLAPDPARVAAWDERLGEFAGLKVGIVWSGNPGNDLNSDRSVPVRQLLQLGDVPGVRLFNLQFGSPAAELRCADTAGIVVDWTDQVNDFADSAALVAGLDLVITVCTSMAHLAGALGVPVWTLISAAPDWRWRLATERSPWYPSMRLYRQERPGSWSEVLERVVRDLSIAGQSRAPDSGAAL